MAYLYGSLFTQTRANAKLIYIHVLIIIIVNVKSKSYFNRDVENFIHTGYMYYLHSRSREGKKQRERNVDKERKKERKEGELGARTYPATRQKCETELVGPFILFFFRCKQPACITQIPGSHLQGSQSSGNDGLRGGEEKQESTAYMVEKYTCIMLFILSSLSAKVYVSSSSPSSSSSMIPSSLHGGEASPLFLQSSFGPLLLFLFPRAYPPYISTRSRYPDPEIHLEMPVKSSEEDRLDIQGLLQPYHDASRNSLV